MSRIHSTTGGGKEYNGEQNKLGPYSEACG